MIKPAQQQSVCIEIGRWPKILVTDSIPPRNMDPWACQQILVVTCKLRSRSGTQRGIAGNRALEISIVPAGDMQSRHLNLVITITDVQVSPEGLLIRIRLTMQNPIANITRQFWIGNRGMLCIRHEAGLGTHIAPR